MKAQIASIHLFWRWSKESKSGSFPPVSLCHSDCISHCTRFFQRSACPHFCVTFARGAQCVAMNRAVGTKAKHQLTNVGKEIFCRQRQDKFRSRGRTASQESFFSTHLHICFKRELFRLGCAIAALDKNFNYSSVKDKNIISISSTSAHPSKSMEQQSNDRINLSEEYDVHWTEASMPIYMDHCRSANNIRGDNGI